MLWAAILLMLSYSLVFTMSCPANGIYDPNFQKCYIYNNQSAVFLEAESTCHSIGGNLAEIRNGFENTAVAGHVKTLTNGHPPPTYWIGANLLLAPKWTWTTNDTALFTNWAPDEPVDPSNFDCGSVRSDTYLWKKELCYSARPFVCTANPIPDPNECPLPRVKRYFSGDSPCDPGYTQYGNQCFKLFTNFIKKMNFYESSMYCQFHENATLPKITSPGVQNFLESLVFREEGYIWLGLTCIGNDGVRNCEWFDASNPTYTNYSPGEPSQHYPIIMSVSNGLWISEWDFRPLTKVVVCQKPARM